MWMYFIIGVVFLLVGLAVHVFKCYFLISGFNTMPKEKKKNVDTKGLGRLMGLYSYLNGAVFILAGFSYLAGMRNMPMFSFAFLVITTIILLVKAQKFDGNLYDTKGKRQKGAGKQFLKTGIGMVITVVAAVILLFFSIRPVKMTILDEGIQIHGMYGQVYNWEEIDELELVEELPNIERRTNGSGVGPYLKGHFRTTEYGAVKLFVNRDKPPFLYLRAGEKIVFLNLSTKQETEQIYQEIAERMNEK